MQEIIQRLKESPVIYLSTVDESGHPRVRPVVLMLEKEGRLFFSTSKKSSIYADLQHHPYVEISVVSPDFSWIRLSGKAKFAEDRDIKVLAINSKPLLQRLFGSPDNPDFQVFFLSEGSAAQIDYSGKAPKISSFKHQII